MTWNAGQSGNPKGRRSIVLPATRRDSYAIKNDLMAFINKCLRMGMDELKSYRPANALEHFILEAFKSAETGKYFPKGMIEASIGRLVEDQSLTDDEKQFLALYREKRDELQARISPVLADSSSDGGDVR